MPLPCPVKGRVTQVDFAMAVPLSWRERARVTGKNTRKNRKGDEFMGSVVKKRRKKMAKHKHKKQLDRDRHKKKK